jgi:hypothetical protein
MCDMCHKIRLAYMPGDKIRGEIVTMAYGVFQVQCGRVDPASL